MAKHNQCIRKLATELRRRVVVTVATTFCNECGIKLCETTGLVIVRQASKERTVCGKCKDIVVARYWTVYAESVSAERK